jgi:hypothetical protein
LVFIAPSASAQAIAPSQELRGGNTISAAILHPGIPFNPEARSLSPHPGVIDNYEYAPNGSFSEDPATDYESVGMEPLLNVYQTLIVYNGSQAGPYPYDFVPDLATCVPDSAQCTQKYGTSLHTGDNYTFVINPNARFYDTTGSSPRSWAVYPNDVLYSFARTCIYSTWPFYQENPGWIQCQALLPYNPNGNGDTYDGLPLHAPLINTPTNILNAITLNSSYCPRSAITGGNGCVTFNTQYSGHNWPNFLELVADPEGASIMPCSWATATGAGIPGLSCSEKSNPTGIVDTAWDPYEEYLSPTGMGDYVGNASFPVPSWVTYLRWHMVGSGPYYLSNITVGASYQLKTNPSWTGTECSWIGCIPVAFEMGTINTVWESRAATGEAALKIGQADLAYIPTSDYSSVLIPLLNRGNVTITYAPSLSIGFSNFDFNFNQSGAQSLLPAGVVLNAPSDLFQDLAFRQFLEHSYPYQTVQSQYNTVDGVTISSLYGGAIPDYMGDYYPTNISWDFKDPNATGNNTAGWWWNQVETEVDGIAAAACSTANPCTFPLVSYTGAPILDEINNLWVKEVSQFSDGAVDVIPVDISLNSLVTDSFNGPGENPMPLYDLSLTANYPDPTDNVVQLYMPDSTYTYSDAVAESLEIYTSNCPAGYVWSVVAVSGVCQGSAYSMMVNFLTEASNDANLAQRVLLYNAAEHIAQQLGIFVPNPGQGTTVWVGTSWLSDSNESLNTNPVVGGDGDNTWYTLEYAPTLLTINSFTANPSTIILGSGTNFTVRANGGTGPLTYSFAGLPRGCSSANLAILACYPTSIGVYNVTVSVVDQTNRSVTKSTTLTVSPGVPTLSSVTITPVAETVYAGGTTSSFTATPDCIVVCPAGTTYSWTLTDSSMGKLNSTTGNSVTFTPGNAAGTLALFVNASLGGKTAGSSATITIIYELSSVSVSPQTITISLGSLPILPIFMATPSCFEGRCPSGIVYSWSLTNNLGTLNASAGQSVIFDDHGWNGIVALFVNATLDGQTVQSEPAMITVEWAALHAVIVSPSLEVLQTGGSYNFTAYPECGTLSCPPWGTYSWSLTNNLCTLYANSGKTESVTAGRTAGDTTLFVNVTINGTTVQSAPVTITITSPGTPSTGVLGLPGMQGYFVLGIGAVAGLLVAVVWVRALLPSPTKNPPPPSSREVEPPKDRT